MKRIILMLVLLVFILVGCGSPVDDYMEQVEELGVDVTLEGISQDLDNLFSGDIATISESDLDNVAKNVSEFKGVINTISVDDEEVKGIHSYLVNYVDKLDGLIGMLKDFNNTLNKTKLLDEKMSEIDKAAENIGAKLSQSSAVDDKAYKYFITQKNLDKVIVFLDDLENLVESNDDVTKKLENIKKIVNQAPASTVDGQKINEMLKDLVDLSEEYIISYQKGEQIEKSLTDYDQKINQQLSGLEQDITAWGTALAEYYE